MNIAAALHLESIEAQAAKLLACAETHIYFRGEWTGMQGVNDKAIDLSPGQRKWMWQTTRSTSNLQRRLPFYINY